MALFQWEGKYGARPDGHGGRRVRQPSIVLAEEEIVFVKRDAELQASLPVLRPT